MRTTNPAIVSILLMTAIGAALIAAFLLASAPAGAQSAEPGTAVRNEFGPQGGRNANLCRGACGAGCPDTCAQSVSYECSDDRRLRRVTSYFCGTHPGCRVHDDCLDACPKGGEEGKRCSTQCDTDVVDQYGIGDAGSWLTGGGPYDGRILFMYTRDAADAQEPMFVCPAGATLECGGNARCVANGNVVEPVFDSYLGSGGSAMRVANLATGPACGDSVCNHSPDIIVTGDDSCPGGNCTRFGMEFDYENADPTAPLECRTSTSGGDGDFIGDLLKQGADAMDSRGTMPDANSDDGMEALIGLFGEIMAGADSAEDVNISMAPLDEQGNPIESQRVGSTPGGGPPPIPNTIALPSSSGHLFVPMYQLATGVQAGQVKERRLRCTHKGAPVLDTTFRLHAG